MKIDEFLWQSIQRIMPPSAPPKLPHLCGVIDGHVKVFLVDGDDIKLRPRMRKSERGYDESDHMDFCEGGNGVEDPGLCPKDVILIDDDLHPRSWPFICYHEAVERRAMLGGMSYNKAHEQANAAEKFLRQRSRGTGFVSGAQESSRSVSSV